MLGRLDLASTAETVALMLAGFLQSSGIRRRRNSGPVDRPQRATVRASDVRRERLALSAAAVASVDRGS
jgi:hypothetical protein